MAWDLGDTVPITGTVRNAAGTPTNASSIALTIQLPDATTVTPTVTNPPATTGVYAYDYVATMPGRHSYRLVSTGPAAAFTDVFDVRESFPGYIISLADARRVLKFDSTSSDEELRGVVEAATAVIERHTGKTIARRTVVEYQAVCGNHLWLNHRPVLSVTSIATTDAVTSWTVGNLDLDAAMGRLTVRTGAAFRGSLVITYVAGYQVIPPNYTEAAEIIVQSLWSTQRSEFGSPQVGGLDAPGEGFTSFGSVLPLAARQLLGPPPPMVA